MKIDKALFYEIHKKFKTEQEVIKFLLIKKFRTNGKLIYCDRCERLTKLIQINDRPHTFVCSRCKKNFCVTKGTIFYQTRLPLKEWLYVTLLIKKTLETRAIDISRQLGISCSAASRMLKKIRGENEKN